MTQIKSSEFAELSEKQRKTQFLMNIFWLLAVAIISSLFYLERAENKKKPIYVIADNGRFMARPSSDETVYDFDVKNDVRVFITNFYQYDKSDFNEHIETALNLVDNINGKTIYASVKAAKIYEALRDKNARTKVEFDSIKVNMTARPIHVQVYFKQHIYVSDLKMTNPVAAQFDLVPFSRSETNPFGLMITNFNYIPYTVMNNMVKDPNFTSGQDARKQIEEIKQQTTGSEQTK